MPTKETRRSISDGEEPVYVYTAEEHAKWQALYRSLYTPDGVYRIPHNRERCHAALDAIDGGTYSKEIGGQDVE